MKQTVEIDVTITVEVDFAVYPPEPDVGIFNEYAEIQHITSPDGTSIDGDVLKALNNAIGGDLEEMVNDRLDLDE